MRVLVCGGRTFCDHLQFKTVMDKLHKERNITHVIQGGARGADYLAHVWSARKGIKESVFNPDWKAFGKSAGPIRNRVMLDEGKPDLVVAFPGGEGTAHMVAYARKKGVEVIVIEKEPPPLEGIVVMTLDKPDSMERMHNTFKKIFGE